MTVNIENITGGGGGEFFPIKPLTPLLFFSDNFRRPPDDPNRVPVALPQIDCTSLGPDWVTQWLTAESPDSPIVPVIRTVAQYRGECAFISTDPTRQNMTIVFPKRTTWLGSFGLSQYVQFRMRQPPVTDAFVYHVTVWVAAAGSGSYFPGCQSQPGFFYVRSEAGPAGYTSTSLGVAFTYTATSLNPDPGILYERFQTLPDAPLETLIRFESHYLPAIGSWDLRVLFDGVLVYTVTTGALFIGIPGMGCSSLGSPSSPLGVVENFQCGWLA